jgi:histidine phosphotransfer protein HptB
MQVAEFMEFPTNSFTMTHSNDSARSALPIDWKQLQQISDGNEEFELELLEIFLTETGKLLQHAQRAVLNQDVTQLNYVAHQIKGGSGNIGMGEMVRLAKELEIQAKTQDWQNAANCLEQLGRSLNYVQNFLQAP